MGKEMAYSEAQHGVHRPLVVRLPGFRNEKIATVAPPKLAPGTQKRTPEWMVSFSTLSSALLGGTSAVQLGLGKKVVTNLMDRIKATSSVDKMSGFTELFGWFSEMTRFVSGHVAGKLLISGSIKNSPLVLMIPAGTAAATLEEALFTGQLITCITLIRLGYVGGLLQVLQVVIFHHCRLTNFQQQLDRLIIHCTVLEKTNHICVFDQQGTPTGAGVSYMNISTTERESSPMGL